MTVGRRIRPLYLLLSFSAAAFCQQQVKCGNGEIHIKINVEELALKYGGQSLQVTLSGLSVLGAKIASDPKTLQAAAEATQQWNELLKGLATGYNSCAISQQQYYDGLNRIYPRLKDDAAALEQIRQMLAKGQHVDAGSFGRILDAYFSNLRQFALAANTRIVEAIRHIVETSESRILQNQERSTEQILSRMDALQRSLEATAKPAEVSKTISALRKELDTQADVAENEYRAGYQLLEKFQFKESIPHLQAAIRAVPLPQFYDTLATVFAEIPDLEQAEQTAREGLKRVADKSDIKAALAKSLGLILFNKGNLLLAKGQLELALYNAEAAYGRDDRRVARFVIPLSTVLRHLGNLKLADYYARRAVELAQTTDGATGDDDTAAAFNNLGLILQEEKDLEGAEASFSTALKITETLHGRARIGVQVNNIGLIEAAQGKLDAAADHFKEAIKIEETIYGSYHPTLATSASNLGIILQRMNDLNGAIVQFKRSLNIEETVFGPNHLRVALRAGLLGDALSKKGDLVSARTYFKRAFDICNIQSGPSSALTRKYKEALDTLDRQQ